MIIDWGSFALASLGGAMIGLGAAGMLLFQGRIAGISGIVGGLLRPQPSELPWRLAFVAGLLSAGFLASLFAPQAMAVPLGRSVLTVALAGFIVGIGVRMGNGCTSGHGVCGLTRRSPRSGVATLTFMATGIATAVIAGSLSGGAP